MSSIRLVRILSAAVVAAIAAWSSYWHMVHVALRHGERSEVAYVLPLSVNGVLTIAAIVMAEDRRAHQPVRPIAKAAFVLALSASIAANVAGAQPNLGGRLIAAWPAIALLLIVEMLVFTRPGPAQTSPDLAPAPVAASRRDPPEHRRVSAARDQPDHPPELRRKFPPEPDHTFHPPPHDMFRPEQHRTTGARQRRRSAASTRQLAADLLAADPSLTRDQVAARIGISTRRLRTVLSPPQTPRN